MTVHDIKCWPESFAPLWEGTKTFEYRYDDRGYAVGDHLTIREWLPLERTYTGREINALVLHILRGGVASFAPLHSGWVIMSIVRFVPGDGEL